LEHGTDITPEGLLYDAEHDLLVIAKFFVVCIHWLVFGVMMSLLYEIKLIMWRDQRIVTDWCFVQGSSIY